MRIPFLYCLLLVCRGAAQAKPRRHISEPVVQRETDFVLIDEFTISKPIDTKCELNSEVARLGDRG